MSVLFTTVFQIATIKAIGEIHQTNERLVSKETAMLHGWGGETLKFGIK